jgi:hypothetical protein
MHASEISFCKKIGFNIKCDVLRQKIIDDLDKLNCKIIQKHHDHYTDEKNNILTSNPHLMTLRTNGNPYYLYLTTYNGINQCIFIDKKIQNGYFFPRMVIVKFWFNDNLFQNTLFTGEMVNTTDGSWKYLIHDIYADSGNDTQNINLVNRINRISYILESSYVADNRQDVCDMQVKRYFTFNEFDEMEKLKGQLPYSCRGIYFKPLFLKFKDILYNFDGSVVKKVNVSQPTQPKAHFQTLQPPPPPPRSVDNILYYQKTKTPDIYTVTDSAGKDCGIALVNSLKTSRMMRERFLSSSPIDKVKFKSSFNSQFTKWVPMTELIS